jgi:hypothetical protein
MTGSLLIGVKHTIKERMVGIDYWRRRHMHRTVPVLPPGDDRAIVEGLRTFGGYMSSLDALDLPGTSAMMKAADELSALIADRAPFKGGFCVHASEEEVARKPAIIRWGLNERLLAIIENYIGLPVRYRGVVVRRDQKGGEQLETRLWHRDGEDKRIVKVIVYLNDVDRGGGAYEFIPLPSAPPLWRTAPLGNRIDERAMSRFVPETAGRPCIGSRGAVTFTDTCSVFHRGQIAHSEDRRALFFAYNSTSPRMPESCLPLFDRARFVATEKDLSPKQLAAIGL